MDRQNKLNWLKSMMNGCRIGAVILALLVILVTASHEKVFAEGSWQMGLFETDTINHAQPLLDYQSNCYGASSGLRKDPLANRTRPIYVDILNANEVINIYACGSNTTDQVTVEIYQTSGPPNFTTGTQVHTTTITSTTDAGYVAPNDDFNHLLYDPSVPTTPPPIQYTAGVGTYEIRLSNDSQNTDDPDYDDYLKRFDITVTPNATTAVDPRVNSGRVWAYRWAANTYHFTEAYSTDADFFAVADGGFTNTYYIWKLDLNNFAGFMYEIVANNMGVNSPNPAGENVAGLSVPMGPDSADPPENSVDPLYPIYLSYPAYPFTLADPNGAQKPGLTSFTFRAEGSTPDDNTISPAFTSGVQDKGIFEFTTNLTDVGVYSLIIDTNRDNTFGAGDVLLMGEVAAGVTNSVTWDGKDNSGNFVAVGAYKARLEVRTGEFHFVATDVETSGGDENGLTIYNMTSSSSQSSVAVFWDDETILGGNSNLPNGILAGRHTWGTFVSSSFGNGRFIDTYVYGAKADYLELTVIIDNNDANDPPVAADDSTSTQENTPVTLSVLNNDTDPEGNMDVATVDLDPTTAGRQTTFTVAGQGTFEVDDTGVVTFTPVTGFTGVATIPYTVDDDEPLTSNEANITVTVNKAAPPNQPPVAANDSASTPANTPVSLSAVANDSDPDGNINAGTVDLDPSTPGRQTTYTKPNEGTFTVNGSGLVTFTPLPEFSGVSSIPYTVNDNQGLTSNQATIAITVAANIPPVANNDTAETPWNTPVTLSAVGNDTDADGTVDPATVDLDPSTPGIQTTFTKAGEGTFTVNNAGAVTFTPLDTFSGVSTIPYTVNDNLGAVSNPANISVTVLNAPPVANNDSAETPANTPVTLSAVGNDTDTDGTVDPATVDLDPSTPGRQTTFTVPNEGTFTVDDAGAVTFTPVPAFKGTSTIPYTVNDNLGATSNPANIAITVKENIPPVAEDDSETTPWNTPVTLSAINNDSDEDGDIDPATVDLDPDTPGRQTTFTVEGEGTFTVDDNGDVTFTPLPTFSGVSTIPYTVNDDIGATSNVANITITVENGPPVAENDSASTPLNTPVSVPVLTNDSDPNGDPITVTDIVTHPANGTVTFSPDGTVIYTPNENFAGIDTFVYEISDGNGGTDTAVVTINVSDDAPTAVSDSAVTPPETPVDIPVISNDSDPNDDPLTVTGITTPENGTVTDNGDGTVTYTPNPGFIGTDTFEYTITDPQGNTDTAIVTVVVNPEVPNAVDDTGRTPADTPITVNVIANDSDPDGDPLTVTGITQPANGTVIDKGDGTVTYTPDPGFSGTDTFTYTVCDDDGNCDMATVTITVENSPPDAVDDSATTPADTPVSVPVLENDSDPNDDPLTVDEFTQPPNGTVTDNGDGTVTYTPDPGFKGTDTFTYTACDDHGACDEATVTVTTKNAPPDAVDDSASTPFNTPVSIPVLNNDTDPNDDPLTVGTITQPENGTVTRNDDGTVTYTPDPGFSGTDTFTYEACDEEGDCDTATVTVTTANGPPVAKDDSTSTPLNTPVSVPVLTNDIDPNGDPLTVTRIVSQPQNGTVSFTPDGTVVYTPDGNFTGIDTFEYEISDGNGGTDIATVTINVNDNAPAAVNDNAATPPSTPVDIPVIANDSDPNDDPLTVTDITTPANGTVKDNGDGTVTYTPNPGFTGTDTFEYTITDPQGNTDTATVTVVVDPDVPNVVNNPQIAEPDTPLTIDPLPGNSGGPGGGASIVSVSQPGNGTVTLNDDGTLTYTPNPGFAGTDTFTYTVCTSSGRCNTISTSVKVRSGPPNAVDDSSSTRPNTPVSVPVLTNDSDPNGDPITVTQITSQPKNGTVTFTPDGTVIYTPDGNFTGTDTFSYEITDGRGGFDTAVVRITVDDDTPSALSDSAVTPPDTPIDIPVLDNDDDPNGDPLTVTDITDPENGTVTINDDGTVTYTPDPEFRGTDTFEYTITDPDGNTDTAIVTVVVNPDIPQASDNTETAEPDTPLTVDVVSGDTDPNGDPLTIVSVTQPGNGTVTLNDDGTLTYTPEPGFAGTDTFTYTVCDNHGNCDTASMSVKVKNNLPNAVDDSTSTPPNTPVSVPVLTNDSDPNGDPLTVTRIVTPPENGTVTFTPEGTVIYTPDGDFTGTDTFVYEITDGHGGFDTAVVTINVDDQPPTATTDSAVTPPDTPIDIPVLDNDTDPDGDPLTVTDITTPDNGTVTVNDDGTVTYTPNPGFRGTDTFEYIITDPDGNTDTAIVTVVVNPKTPNAADNTYSAKPDTPVKLDVLDNDTDPNGDPITVTKVTQPGNGTVTDNGDGTVTYTPDPGFAGTDTFTYTVCDDNGNCDTATVTMVVENAPPEAQKDFASTPPNTPVSIPVLTNDSDPNGDDLTITGISKQPANGTVTFGPDGTLIYTPRGNFTGTDTFEYTISDGHGGTSAAKVKVTIDEDTPTAIPDSAVTPPDTPITIPVLDNDTDPNGDPLKISGVNPPKNGKVTVNKDGTLTYIPNPGFVGTDTFTYTVKDPDGKTAKATVTVVVDPDMPSAWDNSYTTEAEKPVTIDVLGNDTDPNGDPLKLRNFSRPAHGTVSQNDDGTLTYTPDPGFSGSDTFTYTVCDNHGNCDVATVTVTVRNSPPVAEDDTSSTPPDTPVSVPVLTNDSDPNGHELTVTAINRLPKNGSVTFNDDGTVIYTPDPGFTGTDTFEYTISDGHGGTDTATVTIVVDDETPAAVADSVVTSPENPVNINLLSNDTDPNGGDLKIVKITQPHNGKVTDNGDGTVTYTPDPRFTGTDTFTYTVEDSEGKTNTVIVTVEVDPYTPSAVDDGAVTLRDKSITFDLLENDSDPNDDPLSLDRITQPANGTVVKNDDGTVTYTPKDGFIGTDTFTYTVCDDNGNCDIASATVKVENTPPIALDDSTATRPNTPVSVPVMVNDSDPDGDNITLTEIQVPPKNGTVTFTPDGTVIYTPDPGFTGTDTFEYTIADGHGATDTAVVTIVVDDVTPTAVADSLVTEPDTPVTVDGMTNDTDPNGDPLTVIDFTQPEHGTLTDNGDGTLTYTPDPGFTGDDTFTYTIEDEDGNTDTAVVMVVVKEDVPRGVDNTVITQGGQPITVDILSDDVDPNDDLLTVKGITDPANGTADYNDDGTVTYTPDPGFIGTETFTYTVCDAEENCDIAAITVTVENTPPSPLNDYASTLVNTPVSIPVLDNDKDINGDPLNLVGISTPPANGTVTINPDGTVTYTPNEGFEGTDTFTYLVEDDKGGITVATVTVTVSDEVPAAQDDTASARPETPTKIEVLKNDTDPNDDPLTVKDVTDPPHGSVLINEDGTVTYTPDPGFIGTDTFTYTVCDDNGHCDTADVTVTVENEPPIAADDEESTPMNTPVSVPILGNDRDPDGDPLSVTFLGTPENGEVRLNPDGTVTYIPNDGFIGTDTFTYAISDGKGGTDTATVTITVYNDPPIAVADKVSTDPDTPVEINVLMNDSDPDGDPLTIIEISQPENGTAVIDDRGTPDDPSDDTVIYTPNPGFIGTDTFTYTISDGHGGTAQAPVEVVIEQAIRREAISGVVFDDLNGDGIQDPGEPGIPGVVVELVSSTGMRIQAITSADGTYRFTDLPPGTYSVTETDPDGFMSSTPNSVQITLTGEGDAAADFGDYRPASVGGTIFDDLDGSGIQDSGEAPLSGVSVYADLNGNGILDPNEPFAVTDADGNYRISGLAPGDYTIRIDSQSIPEGYHPTTPDVIPVTLMSGQAYEDADFGYRLENGVVTGYVWDDADRNGVQGVDESGVEDIAVDLIDSSGTVVETVMTDKDGFYQFENLAPGEYEIAFDLPDDYAFTIPYRGSDTALDSDADEISGRTRGFTISEDDPLLLMDAGMFELAADPHVMSSVRDVNGESLEPGDVLWYSATIYNAGTAPAEGVVYTNLPGEYVSLVSHLDSTTTSQGTVIRGNTGGDEDIRIEVGTIPPGESVVITYLVQLNSDIPECAWITDQGVVSGSNFTDEPTDFLSQPAVNAPSVIGPVCEEPSPNISVDAVKSATDVNGGSLKPGDIIEYHVDITNNGADIAKNLVYSDSSPVYTGLLSESIAAMCGTGNGSCNIGDFSILNSQFSIPIGDLAPGETVSITFRVRVEEDASQNAMIFSQGMVNGNGNILVYTDDPAAPNSDDPTLVRVTGEPVIEVYKTVLDENGGSVNPGDILEYVVTITDTGGANAGNVVFHDQPDGYISLISGTVATTQGTVSEGNAEGDQAVTVEAGSLDNGQTVTVRFQVQLSKQTPDGAVIPNQGWITSDNLPLEYSDDPSTRTIDDPTVVIAVTDPYVVDPPSAYKDITGEGDGVIYWEMLWINDKNADAVLVHIEDVLPDHLTYIEGSINADYGEFWYDEQTRAVAWEGSIPGNGGEVRIWYHTAVPDDVNEVENQACAIWDKNANGDWRDEADSLLISEFSTVNPQVCTDDPNTLDMQDATIWSRAALSLGSSVWQDVNNDGIYQPESETGINGVRINLYRQQTERSADYTPDAENFVASTITSTIDGEAGRYLFENLAPGNYVVQIAPENFEDGGVLSGAANSPGDSDPDDDVNNDDNGFIMDDDSGVISKPVTLTVGGEPIDDGDEDANTNLTVDFGFSLPLPCDFAMGGIVWYDANADGIYQPESETGINEVSVSIWRDADFSGDFDPDADAFVAVTSTSSAADEAGRYVFRNLCEGDYIILIEPENFDRGDLLEGYSLTTGNSSRSVSLNPYEEPSADFGFYQDDSGLPMKPF
jgi:CshA-type fibril repeat protein